MTNAWQVRAGRSGERDQEALDEGLVILGWNDVPDLVIYQNKSQLRSDLRARYPSRSASVIGNWTGQLWRFFHDIAEGDLVVMPLKSQRQLAIGEVAGPYRFRLDAKPGFRHVRPVRWLRTDVERSEFGADLRGSMGSLLTVCQLSRHDAATRIAEIANKRPDPGWRHELANVDPEVTPDELWQAVAESTTPVRLTVRELLAKWGFTRRTAVSQGVIQADLAERGITTRPNFTLVRIDSVVELVTVAGEPDDPDTPVEPGASAEAAESAELPVKWLVSAVLPDDPRVETVPAGSPLIVAVTKMLATNYSQLAVIDEDENYQGAVSWESIGRARLANPEANLRDATVDVRVVNYDDDLFAQLDEIYQRGFVLVRGEDRRKLIGIVTAHDLAKQFGTLARPFSLVEEAELRMRRQARRTLPYAKFAGRYANGIPTFGAFGKLLQDEEMFQLMGWELDHGTFLELLDRVRTIRNELMHFSQDTLPAQDLEMIDGFVSMLRAVDRSS